LSDRGLERCLPLITEYGTHYVANMRLSFELLKEICESQEGIVRITRNDESGNGLLDKQNG
jgi:hypothetical protein